MVPRRLSRIYTVFGRVIPGGGCEGKESTFPHSIGDPHRAPLFCYCHQMNWWVVQRVQMGVLIWDAVHSHRDVQAPWDDVLEKVWLRCDDAKKVGCLRGLEYCGWCRRRVWALRYQTGALYPAVEWTMAQVAVRNVVTEAPQQEPARLLESATRDVNFLRSDSNVWAVREYPGQRYSEVCGLGEKGQGLVVVVDFQLTFSLLVVEVEDGQNCFF